MVCQDCVLYDTHHHLLREDEDNHSLENILGMDKGIDQLVKFMEVLGAFVKAPDPR